MVMSRTIKGTRKMIGLGCRLYRNAMGVSEGGGVLAAICSNPDGIGLRYFTRGGVSVGRGRN